MTYANAGHRTSLLNERANATGADEAEMFVLDELITEGTLPPPDFVKLDVQGFELEVLKGAERALRGCQAVLVEVNFFRFDFCPTGPLAHEVIDYLRERDFVWYEVMGLARRTYDDALGQMDLMFVREDHPLRRSIEWGPFG